MLALRNSKYQIGTTMSNFADRALQKMNSVSHCYKFMFPKVFIATTASANHPNGLTCCEKCFFKVPL